VQLKKCTFSSHFASMPLTIYRSSAGSGKTFTLVKSYLEIILQNPYAFRHILALTFTNKAAAEMKERILLYLSKISSQPIDAEHAANKVLLPQLLEGGLKEFDEKTLRTNAAKALKLIIHNYTEFAVGTIDSFMQRVVRSFAFDMHLPHDFDTELDQNPIIRDATNNLLEVTGTDVIITKILQDVLFELMDDEAGWNIRVKVEEAASKSFDERSRYFLEKLNCISPLELRDLCGKLRKDLHFAQKALAGIAEPSWNSIQAAGLDVNAFVYGANGGPGQHLKRIAEGDLSKLIVGSRLQKSLDEGKWYASKASPLQKEAIDRLVPQMTSCFLAIAEKSGAYFLLKNISNNLHTLSLLAITDMAVQNAKAQKGVVHISEFNRRIRQIVLAEPVPFIYARLGEKFHHFLLDEFQDTSVVQWHNLLPLVSNALAGLENGQETQSLIVGDGKQSIYRWRNSDVELFQALPRVYNKPDQAAFDDAENLLLQHSSLKNLEENFRSKTEIIEFNNRFFAQFSAQNLVGTTQAIYADLLQKSRPQNTGGLVKLGFYEKENQPEIVLETVRSLLMEGFALRDMAILTRDNKNASLLANFLITNNIPVISSESLLLQSSATVSYVINVMQLVDNKSNEVALVSALVFLERKAINALTSTLLQNSWKADEFFKTYLNADGNTLKQKGIYALCEAIIANSPAINASDPYLRFLLDNVYLFESNDKGTLTQFLDYWEKQGKKLSVNIPEGIDAIRIMTIHKSKGLAFRVVIYPFVSDSRSTKNTLWADTEGLDLQGIPVVLLNLNSDLEQTPLKDLYLAEKGRQQLDNTNLLYVAFTRAEERLYVFCNKLSKSENAESLQNKIADALQQAFEGYAYGADFLFPASHSPKDKSEGMMHSILGPNSKPFISIPWEERIRISKLAPEWWDTLDPDQERRYGKIIHQMLSELKSSQDAAALVQAYCDAGVLNELEQAEVQRLFAQVFAITQVQELFHEQGQGLTEREILTAEGDVLRPDRVVLKPHETLVVDYKTGVKHESHRAQVLRYKDEIAKMGYPNVKACLLYLQPPELIEVS
jgi:ATP-dependent exoDNAse (exonuclease V) beta subunit